jgi:integrase
MEMGFIEKRSGRYRARYRDPLGRQRSETFTRKADAERFLREMRVDIERGRWIDPAGADVALASWAEEFLSLARRLSPSTQETYARDLRRYVLPRFGSYRLGRLPADEVENWLNDEIAAGIAPSSVHRHYRVLRRVLQVAVEKEKLPTNPCDRVQPPRVPKREMVFLTWEEAVDLAEAIHERYRALIYLAVDSGMRWSELVGLRRAKVDLNRGKVRVTEQLIRLESREWFRKEPKTAAGVRSITISRETAEILAEHVEQFTFPGLDSLVFSNKAGNPLISSSFWQHYFQPALQTAGFSCRFHDLRHTSVALAIAEGAHPKAIQTRMGHSSISVTLDRYGHLFPELDEAIAVGFGERLAETRRV